MDRERIDTGKPQGGAAPWPGAPSERTKEGGLKSEKSAPAGLSEGDGRAKQADDGEPERDTEKPGGMLGEG